MHSHANTKVAPEFDPWRSSFHQLESRCVAGGASKGLVSSGIGISFTEILVHLNPNRLSS